jgi:hypothetical protein
MTEKPESVAPFSERFSENNPDMPFSLSPAAELKPVDVESEAFKKWFGQSRVVDGEGKPLRVYHGTGSVFDEFKPLSRSPDFGFHFGTVNQANHFAQKAGIGGNVMPVHYGTPHCQDQNLTKLR